MKYLVAMVVVVLVVDGLLWLNTIYPVLPSAANFAHSLSSAVSNNWHDFLAGKTPEPVATTTVTSTAPTDLNAQIKAEVDRALADKLASLSSGGGQSSGLVVVPAGQASATPEVIAKSFSDQVQVQPDASGQSGVITPIFRNTTGQPYLYIMTPIRQ